MKIDSTRLVRKFTEQVNRCPECHFLPIQCSVLGTELNTYFRFICPNDECNFRPGRYRPTKEEAAKDWNKLTSTATTQPENAPQVAPVNGTEASHE